jgi:hypothetical protein
VTVDRFAYSFAEQARLQRLQQEAIAQQQEAINRARAEAEWARQWWQGRDVPHPDDVIEGEYTVIEPVAALPKPEET